MVCGTSSMKIIQTFWSKPFFEAERMKGLQQACGWCNPLHYYMSHALSCLSLRQFYDDVELYTDEEGKRLLVDELHLPYTSVHMLPDELKSYPSELWALGKLYAYHDQREPFLHVDNDVYIWQRFPERIEQAPLVAQNYERDIAFNRANIMNVMVMANDIPPYMRHMKTTDEANMGVFGGTDIGFIRRYAEEALRFALSNVETLRQLRYHYYFNTVFEQYLLTCLAASEGREITYAFHDVDDHFSQMVRFDEVPEPQWYIHTCGPWKKLYSIGNNVAVHLRERFPDNYRQVMDWYGRQTVAAISSERQRNVITQSENNHTRLSVIIPAYNVEALVGHCLQTVLSQTWRDMEVIVIDDGSTDSTALRIAEIAEVDSRVRLIRQKHQGVAAARNCGMAESTGDFITFVDSDDYLHPQFAELMMLALNRHPNADMCMTHSVRVTKLRDDALSRNYDKLTTAIGDGDILRSALFLGFRQISFEQFHTCHGKLFRRHLLEGLLFPEEYSMYEDAVFMNRVYKRVSQCVQVGHRLYFWLIHSCSTLVSSSVGRLQGMSAYRQCLSETPRTDSKVCAACLQRIVLHSAWIRSYIDDGHYSHFDRRELHAATHVPLRLFVGFLLSPHIKLKKKWRILRLLYNRKARQAFNNGEFVVKDDGAPLK